MNFYYTPTIVDRFKLEAPELYRILERSPISFKHLSELSLLIQYDRQEPSVGLEVTLEFLKLRRLPKRRTLEWLAAHNIRTDQELANNITRPAATMFVDIVTYYPQFIATKHISLE